MAAFNGFQCPVCGSPLTVSGTSLRCEKGHSYDVARKGYVHLHHTTVEGFYDKALFEARRAIFDAGFYAPVAEALKESLLPLSPTALLDAGCGEGYYLNCLSLFLPQCFLVGLDLSKEAILAASSRESAAILSVGDLGRLPFQNNVFDALLSIPSPANYLSFSRVLKKDGRFGRCDVFLLDCVTTMITNHMMDSGLDFDTCALEDVQRIEDDIRAQADALLALMRRRGKRLVIVTNEVGQGVVPAYRMGNLFRDIAGRTNAHIAREADEVYCMISGLPLRLK
jgi:adenosyl cobinamide kinase/adenosyl cobinamide phosphate guanylyltransferase